jgi:hypothetical protein
MQVTTAIIRLAKVGKNLPLPESFMKRFSLSSRVAVSVSAIAWTMVVVTSPLIAQNGDAPFKGLVPEVQMTDENNVDLLSAKANIPIALASFEKDATKMSLSLNLNAPYRYDWDFSMVPSNNSAKVAISNVVMNSLNILWGTSDLQSGGTPIRLAGFPGGGGYYNGTNFSGVHTNSDGSTIRESVGTSYATEMIFPDASKNGIFDRIGTRARNQLGGFPPGNQYVSTVYNFFADLDFPDGETWKVYANSQPTGFPAGGNFYRPKFLVSNKGYGIQISYASDATNSSDWYTITSVIAYNKAEYFCNESNLVDCPSLASLPRDALFTYGEADGSLTISYPKTGEAIKVIFDKSASKTTVRIKSVEKVGVTNSKVTYGYSAYGIQGELGVTSLPYLGSVTTSDGTWTYNYSPDTYGLLSDLAWMSRTAPDGSQISAVGEYMLGQGSITDELNRTVEIHNCIGSYPFRLNCTKLPNGRSASYQRDSRNNVTHLELRPATGSSDPILHFYATYPAECLNPRTCNRPLTVTDAKGNVTTYTYDPNHGGTLTEEPPADANGVHPSRKYYYAQRYALIKDSSGNYVQSTSPLWVKVEERMCKVSTLDTSAGTCSAGASDLIKTSYEYGPTSAAANNLLVRGVAVTAEGQTLRTCYNFDTKGRKISETKPAANLSVCP